MVSTHLAINAEKTAKLNSRVIIMAKVKVIDNRFSLRVYEIKDKFNQNEI